MQRVIKFSLLILIVLGISLVAVRSNSTAQTINPDDYGQITIQLGADPQSEWIFNFLMDSPAAPNFLWMWGSQGTGNDQFNFTDPGIAVDKNGNVFVADNVNHRIVKFNSTGEFERTWGKGVGGGAGFQSCTTTCSAGLPGSALGEMNNPISVAVDTDGNVYVVDAGNLRVQKYNNSGTFQRMWGWGVKTGAAAFETCQSGTCLIGLEGSGDGQFSGMSDIVAVTSSQTYGDTTVYSTNIYVTEIGNQRVQSFKGSDGSFQAKWGAAGTGDGQFAEPVAVTAIPNGNVLVADRLNHRVQEFTDAGAFVQTFGWGVATGRSQLELCTANCKEGLAGTGDGQFNNIADINLDYSGMIYVVDSQNTIQKFDRDRNFVKKWGQAGSGEGLFDGIGEIALDKGGQLFVADLGNYRIQVFAATSFALVDDTATNAWNVTNSIIFNLPPDTYTITQPIPDLWKDSVVMCEYDDEEMEAPIITVNSAAIKLGLGDIIRCNFLNANENGAVTIKKVAKPANGQDFAFAFENAEFPDSLLDFGGRGTKEGQFNNPYGIAQDGSGNLVVTDQGNNRVEVFDKDLNFVRMWGWGVTDGSAAAQVCTASCRAGIYGSGVGQFDSPAGVAINSAGTIYVVDSNNDRVQVYDINGILQGAAGETGTAEGQFNHPTWIAIDGDGYLYVVDAGNYRVQKFNSNGVFQQMWGWGVDNGSSALQSCTSGCQAGIQGSGDGQFSDPEGIAVSSNAVYVADGDANRVQAFDADGNLLGGWGGPGTGNGEFNHPTGVGVDPDGNVFVSDRDNNRLQKFNPSGVFMTMYGRVGRDDGGLHQPMGVALDAEKGVGIVEAGNHWVEIYKPTLFWLDHGSDSDKIEQSLKYDGPTGIYTITEYIINQDWVLTATVCTSSDTSDTIVYTRTAARIDLDKDEATECVFNNLDPDPVVTDFEGSPTSGYDPLQVTFTNKSTGTFSQCDWTFGDGGTANGCGTQVYTYTVPGVYTATLTAKGWGGTDTETKPSYITVTKKPLVVDFKGEPTSGGVPLTVVFTNLSTGNFTSCTWDFGDTGTSAECNPTHTYTASGKYTVKLTAKGPVDEGSETKVEYITVSPQAIAAFTGSPTSGIGTLSVTFTNQSTGEWDTCAWDFGDGGVSSLCGNPMHTYNTPGKFTVSLKVSGTGGEDTESKVDYITVYAPVTANFSANPALGPNPLLVTFTNTSAGDFDTCAWDWGDGTTGTTCVDPQHSYAAAGKYTVSLKVSGLGGEDTETKTEYITVYNASVADFSATPLTGIGSATVTFTNLSSGDFATCNWNFGNGQSSTECTPPTQNYPTPGKFTVSLTVNGNGGSDTETKTDYVVVYTPVNADFSANHLTGIAPLTVSFSNLSTGDFDACEWKFGTFATSTSCTDQNLSFSNPGQYTVSLKVSGPGGEETESRTNYITVYEPAVAGFSGSPLTGIGKLTVNFTNESGGEYNTCEWTFGDGQKSDTCGSQSHLYAMPGTFTVSLKVSGDGGENLLTKTDYVTVEDYYWIYLPYTRK